MALSYTRQQTTPATSEATLTVGALTRSIKSLLEQKFAEVVVEGEISNFVDHRSGHRYFTLKDSEAQISSVFWKTRIANFALRDGMRVVCRGRISVYSPQGKYQLDVHQIRPVGIGDLQKAFEALQARLGAEGLFAEDRKRPIPLYPSIIGIVTSETGAALHDILTVLRRRYPLVRVALRAAAVQGIGAELDIARAIQEFNYAPAAQRPDVLIVGRGGGSLEDLWSFNEEAVARAIFASQIPIISAVGHEVDVTIADMVADLRAPTPTAAAELATPDLEDLLGQLNHARYALHQSMNARITSYRRDLSNITSTYGLNACVRDILTSRQQNINDAASGMLRSLNHALELRKLKLQRDTSKLGAMNPFAVLERGYAILHDSKGGIVSTKSSAETARNGVLVFADGQIKVQLG